MTAALHIIVSSLDGLRPSWNTFNYQGRMG